MFPSRRSRSTHEFFHCVFLQERSSNGAFVPGLFPFAQGTQGWFDHQSTAPDSSVATTSGDEAEPGGQAGDEDDGSCRGTAGVFQMAHSPHALVGDLTTLPESIAKCMFQPPDGSLRLDKNSISLEEATGRGVGHDRTSQWECMSSSEKAAVDLLQLLKGKHLFLFDKIQEWRLNCVVEHKDEVSAKNPPLKRKRTIDDLHKKYGHDMLKPSKTVVSLPSLGIDTKLIVFPFRQMLLSLLTSPAAMQPDNLSIDVDNPFGPPAENGSSHVYDDIQTGDVHRLAFNRYCHGPRDLLCEIIIFIDKTHLDVKGKHTLEPVMFTLGIFNRSFRNQNQAWRPLGYLPNLDQLALHQTAEKKHQDWHHCLRIILSELASHQRAGGIDWRFAFGERTLDCTLQIPVNCVLGDNEGHDKLCARMGGRNKEISGKLCRYCDTPFDQLGQPMQWYSNPGKLTHCSDIRRWRNDLTDSNQTKLKDLRYRFHHDGAVDLLFSDPKRGLHGCTPGEVLHTVHMGLETRILECAWQKKRGKRAARKKSTTAPPNRPTATCAPEEEQEEQEEEEEEDEESDDAESVIDGRGEVMEEHSAINQSTRFVFNKKACIRVDVMAKQLHRHLQWQSEKRLPRTTFSKGITRLSKMAGNERTGALLLLLIILVMDHWSLWRRKNARGRLQSGNVPSESDPGYLEHALSAEVAANVVKSLSLVLTFEAYMRWDSIPKTHLKKVEDFIPLFLDQVLRTFPREGSVGNNLLKNHLPLHLCSDIRRFGSPKNFDSGMGEKLLKTAAKMTGRLTNMCSKEFETQTAERYCENLVVDRAFCDRPVFLPAACATNSINDLEEDGTESQNQATGLLLTIGRSHLRHVGGRNNKRPVTNASLPHWRDSCVSAEQVVQTVRDFILPQFPPDTEIQLHNNVTFSGVEYSCNPRYGMNQLSKQDWALVQFKDEHGGQVSVPCHLLCALTLPTEPSAPIELNASFVEEKGVYLLVHSATSEMKDSGPPPYQTADENSSMEGTRAHVDQHLIHKMSKAHYTEGLGGWESATTLLPPSLLLVPLDSLDGPCVGYPDLDNPVNGNNDFYFLSPVEEWPLIFEQCAREAAQQQ